MAEKSLGAHFVECLENGNTKKAKYIVELLGSDVNRQYKGKSVLIWAKEFKNEEVIKALEEKGAVEKAISDEEALRLGEDLIVASNNGNIEKVVELIELGADVNLNDNDYWIALMWASKDGHAKVVEKLIKAGSDVNIKDDEGDVPLMWASYNGHIEVVEELLKNGADVNSKNENDSTSLMWASESGHIEVVEKLIEHGADVNVQNSKGWTALMCASRGACIDVVKKLIEHGADVNLKNASGYEAIDVAKGEETREVIFEAVKKEKAKEDKVRFVQNLNGQLKR